MSEADALRRFRLLANGALLATFLLVVVGGVVRVSDSGLGCGPARSGLHGWPLCKGSLVPASQTHTVLEYSHRVLAAVVVVLLAAILWQALRRFRRERLLVRGAVAAVLLVIVQSLLGALTVEHGLDTALVAIHLGVAMLLLGVLASLSLAARERPPRVADPSGLRPVAALACALLLSAIVAGGVIAGTEEHGTPGAEQASGAHMACGDGFPACNGAFLPFGEGKMVDIQLIHRLAMFLATLAIVALVVALRRRRLEGLTLAIALALAVQLWLGAMNVWQGKSALLVVAHLTVATALWVLVVSTLPLSSRSPHLAGEG